MEEKERNYECPLGVPGGHNLPDEICISSDLVNRHNGDRRKDFKAGGQSMTLPRYIRAHSDENHSENGGVSDVETKISSRKVDSLPSNITMLSLEQGKRNKRKGVLKSVGYFFQRLTRRFSLANSTNGIKIKLGQRGSGSTASSNSSNGGNGSLNDYGTLGGRRSENSSAGGSSHTLDRNCAVSSTQPSSCRLTLEEIPGMIGIHNHGNTCFMNAIIQCLSNTEPLLSYFLSDQYKEDIKRTNKHNSKRFGTKGELTEHLATLLKSLWLKKYTTDISTEFRTIVGKYGSQYRGSFQHDVQEFLIWLLDKVHEDLNIATKKKYRANKSSFGRTDEEVAAEAMANHARSNNSFIHDLFQALYMSSLTCPTCKHQSNTFDPFLSVSLPIPRTSLFQPVLVTCLGDGRSRPACRKVGVVLERGHTVKDLKEELVGACRFFEGLATAEMLILEVTGKNEFHILEDSKLISDPLNNELLYAIDISAQSQPTTDLHKNSFDADNQSDRDTSSSNQNQTNLSSTNKLEQSDGIKYPTLTNGHSVHPANEQSRLPSSDPIGRDAKVGNEVAQCQEAAENPEMSLVIVMNSIPCEDQERKLTVPSLLRLPVSTVIEINRLDAVLKESLCIPKDKEAKYYLITDSGTSDFVRSEVAGAMQAELDEVKRSLIQAATTSICKDRSIIQPVFRLLVEWNNSSVKKSLRLVEEVVEDESVQVAMKLQLQANKGTLDECFQVYTQEEMLGEDNDWHCPNCKVPKRGATKSLTLWSLPEILVIHLKRFRQDHEHRSKLNTLIQFPLTGLDLHHHMPQRSGSVDPCDPTDINGVPLVGGNWNAAMQLRSSKQQSSWLSWRLGCKTDGSVYDLYAVCNHYGDMQGGHYTAFCRNPVTNTWCLFNDSRCTPIKEDEVVTRAAYLLFYQKRLAGSAPPSARDFESRADPTTNGVRDPEVAVTAAVAMATGVNFADSCCLPKSQQATFTKSSNVKKQNFFEVNPSTSRPSSSSQSSGQVTVPLSSVESRPWLVALLEERRRLHGLSHTITQSENNRISRAITSHSLDDLLDGDCDESREDDFRGIPVYTTLHPPPRIKKQLAKAPMATVSTDSVPMTGVSDVVGQSELTKSNGDSFPEKNSFDRSAGLVFEPINSQQTSSSIVNKSTCLTNQPSSSIPSTNGKVLPTNCGQDKTLTPPPMKTDQSESKLKPTLVRQRFLEGID